jgi:hypothetical protein
MSTDQIGPPRPLWGGRARSTPALALLLGALLALTACGTDGSEAAADNPEAAASEPILDFYQCLRDHGLEVADPGPGEEISLQGVDVEVVVEEETGESERRERRLADRGGRRASAESFA